MPIPFPPNFDGKKFMEKFNIRDAHTFWIERGLLYCPILPDLAEADIADCVTDLARKERVDARQLAAKATAKAVPEWATWDAQTANNWGQTNIGIPLATARAALAGMNTLSLATFKVAMNTVLDILDKMWILQQKLTQMEIAIRDEIWPDLPENGNGMTIPNRK